MGQRATRVASSTRPFFKQQVTAFPIQQKRKRTVGETRSGADDGFSFGTPGRVKIPVPEKDPWRPVCLSCPSAGAAVGWVPASRGRAILTSG
jgi:hypothetical protein